jgi:putative transposase
LSDHPHLPPELQSEVMTLVEQTRQRSGWPVRRTLKVLEIPAASYYRWRRVEAWQRLRPRSPTGSIYELLDSERQTIIDYALKHPQVRHRELAWRMLDEGVCGVSSSSVYRVLREADLVCRWKPQAKVKGSGREARPCQPDEKWQTDIKYVRVAERNYYLLSFMDVYSRYIVHHELLTCMDGLSVSTEAAAAIETLDSDTRPDIQSDHGSGFIAGEFAETLSESRVTHTKIRPHTPTDNAEIERYHRTIGDQIDEHDLEDYTQAKSVIARIITEYNDVRLHSALMFLRPVDYYRGNPEALLAERRRKLSTARELRKQENIRLRQRLLPWPEAETVSYPTQRTVSL